MVRWGIISAFRIHWKILKFQPQAELWSKTWTRFSSKKTYFWLRSSFSLISRGASSNLRAQSRCGINWSVLSAGAITFWPITPVPVGIFEFSQRILNAEKNRQNGHARTSRTGNCRKPKLCVKSGISSTPYPVGKFFSIFALRVEFRIAGDGRPHFALGRNQGENRKFFALGRNKGENRKIRMITD